MVKSTVVGRIARTLNDAYVGGHNMDITVNYTIFLVERKFLKWTRRKFVIERNIPYVPDPLYDGEYNTNRRLQVIARMMDAEARRIILEHGSSSEQKDDKGKLK